MSLLQLVPLVLLLALSFVPVLLLRRRKHTRAQDYFVASGYIPPEVVGNASIAYALRMAAFGPLFAWGASGDLWPAIVASICFGLGLWLLYFLRQPIVSFLCEALGRGGSFTVHEFIARQHGGDPRVRLLAAMLTMLALLGLVAAEALGVAALLRPLLPENGAAVYILAFGLLVLAALYAVPSGNTGTMHSAQVLFGALYFGLFGSTALLLYLHASDLRPVPPRGMLAIVFIAVFCATIVFYRRSKYVDTSPIEDTKGERVFRRIEKILNPCISVFAVLVVVVALMEFYFAGVPAILRDSAAALSAGTKLPGIGLLALALLPLFQPITDMTNWQRIAAVVQDRNQPDPAKRSALQSVLRRYAVESPLVWLFMAMFGALGVIATGMESGAEVMPDVVAQLVAQENEVADTALALLLVTVFAVALSTMSAGLSASLCTLHCDILPACSAATLEESKAIRWTIVVGSGLCLATAVLVFAIDAAAPIGFSGGTFLALLAAFYSAQLSFAPLILGPIMARARGGVGAVRPGWALAILAVAAACGIGAAAVSLTMGAEPWLWAAVPGCLGTGFALFFAARLWPPASPE